MSTILVLLIGALIVGAGCLTVTRRNPIHAALSMLVALCGLGGACTSLDSARRSQG